MTIVSGYFTPHSWKLGFIVKLCYPVLSAGAREQTVELSGHWTTVGCFHILYAYSKVRQYSEYHDRFDKKLRADRPKW